jgi:hypothetical protein
MKSSNFKACNHRIGYPLKSIHVLSILLLVSVAFPITLYGLSMPNLGAQVTGTISIHIGSSTTSTTTPTTVISTTNTGGGGGDSGGGGGPTTTIATGSQTVTTLTSTVDGNTTLTSNITTNVPEFQVGPTVLAPMIGLALLLCDNQLAFKTKRRV